MLTDRDFATANIDVGIAERGDELRDRNIIGFQLSEIGVDIELLCGPAPAVDLHHTRNSEKASGNDIILQRPQIGQPKMRRPDNLIAIDLTDQAGLLDLGDLIARQVDVLLQADRRLGQSEIEIDAIFEGNADKRQAVERCRADIDHAGGRVETHFHRNGVIFLHLLGRKTGRLCRDFKNNRRRIWIGFDIEPRKRDEFRGTEHHKTQDNDRAARQPELE